jgi:hypothetical protein
VNISVRSPNQKIENLILSPLHRCYVFPMTPRPSRASAFALLFLVPLISGIIFFASALTASSAYQESPMVYYQRLINKTVLYPSSLPAFTPSLLDNLPAAPGEAIARLQTEFSEHNLKLVDDLDPAFVLLVPADMDLATQFAALKPSDPHLSAPGSSDLIPPGVMDCRAADLKDALTLYSELANRTVLASDNLPPLGISFRSQTALTKAQANYMMKRVLLLNGVAVVNDGPHLVQVLLLSELNRLRTNAPIPSASDPIVPQDQVPVFKRALQRSSLPHIPNQPVVVVSDPGPSLFDYYCTLSGLQPDSSAAPASRISFKIQTPLTKPELLYAIEKTFELNGFALVTNGNKILLQPKPKK